MIPVSPVRSEIDLALEGTNLDFPDLVSLSIEFAESLLPYEVDLAVRGETANPKLEKRIKKYGKTFYDSNCKPPMTFSREKHGFSRKNLKKQ